MTRTHATVRASVILLAVALAASAARAAPFGAEVLGFGDPLPGEVKVKGATLDAVWRWSEDDGKTTSLAVFSSTDRWRGMQLTDRKLFVQVYRGAAGSLKQVRLVQDGIDACDLDTVAKVLIGSVSVTDVDGDGTAELAFAYDVSCVSDISPSSRKLLVLEGDAKHILRGRSRVDIGGDGRHLEGGEFKAAGFQGEAALLRFAEQRWQKLL
jgi:hypothetical protein